MTTTTTGLGLVLDTDGSMIEVAWPPAHGDNLRAMYDALDCRTVEVVQLGDVDMWIDEEGKFSGHPQVNIAATLMARQAVAIDPRDMIVGRALFLAHNDEGDTVPLTDDQLAQLRGW